MNPLICLPPHSAFPCGGGSTKKGLLGVWLSWFPISATTASSKDPSLTTSLQYFFLLSPISQTAKMRHRAKKDFLNIFSKPARKQPLPIFYSVSVLYFDLSSKRGSPFTYAAPHTFFLMPQGPSWCSVGHTSPNFGWYFQTAEHPKG